MTDTLNNVKAQADVLASTISQQWPTKVLKSDDPADFRPFESPDVGLSEDQVIQSTFATDFGQLINLIKYGLYRSNFF